MPTLGALDVVIGVLQQAQNDVLDVFADVTGFGQGRGIGDGEGHIENLRQRAGQQRFARTGRADQQDVALLDLHFGMRDRPRLTRPPRRCGGLLQDALVMIVHRHRQGFLGVSWPMQCWSSCRLISAGLGTLSLRRLLLAALRDSSLSRTLLQRMTQLSQM